MILRKPYAFLIKNFKKIHILLLIIMLYGIYKTNNLSGFFNNYVTHSSGFFESTLSDTYINFLFYLSFISIVIISLIVLILMKQKDKQIKLYSIICVAYIALTIILIVDSGYLRTIVLQQLTPRTSRMLRDINYIVLIPQIVLSILVFIRAIGFNIKQFNFSKDIEDLQIDVSDNEEFELTIGTDSGKLARLYRKNKRELRYFYLEHKAFIIGILTIILLIAISYSYYNFVVLRKVYNMDEVVRINNISYKLNEVFLTNYDYRGELIKEKNSTFMIIPITFYNGNNDSRQIISRNMNVVIGENIYVPVSKKYTSFIDLGVKYENQKINSDEEKTYLFIYKILDVDLNKETILRYTDRIYFDNAFGPNYIKHKINPISIDEKSIFPKAELKKEVTYELSNIKQTRLTINEIDFKDKYSYKIGDLINYINDPLDNRIILKINYEYKPDKNIKNINKISDLLKTYGVIKYEKDKKQVVLKYRDVTPLKYLDSDLYLSVPAEVENSNSIELIITVRNKVYIHKLK